LHSACPPSSIRKNLPAIISSIVTAILSSILSYNSATNEGRAAAAAAKKTATVAVEKAAASVEDKAKAGYQVTRQDIELLKARMGRLERALRASKLPVKTAPPAAPAPLPTTLEKAVEQVKTDPKP
jgi:hypothetical protein